jgi:hypothetical protein
VKPDTVTTRKGPRSGTSLQGFFYASCLLTPPNEKLLPQLWVSLTSILSDRRGQSCLVGYDSARSITFIWRINQCRGATRWTPHKIVSVMRNYQGTRGTEYFSSVSWGAHRPQHSRGPGSGCFILRLPWYGIAGLTKGHFHRTSILCPITAHSPSTRSHRPRKQPTKNASLSQHPTQNGRYRANIVPVRPACARCKAHEKVQSLV